MNIANRRLTAPSGGARKTAIYCILCPSYHGATLVSLLLGNHSRVRSLGDTIPSQPFPVQCGCGAPFDRCEFWRKVAAIAPDYPGPELFQTKPHYLPRCNGPIALALGLLSIRTGIPFPDGAFATSYERFLEIWGQQDDKDIFVDGYKSLIHYLALKARGFPIKGVIHLIRDPRSFVASSKRMQIGVKNAAIAWVRVHRFIQMITSTVGESAIRLRYEDLCVAPEHHMNALQEWMGLTPEPIIRPVESSRHWLGNSSMINFDGTIKLRQTWQCELTPEELTLVQDRTRRFARSYDYFF
jgi:hypothetical protein